MLRFDGIRPTTVGSWDAYDQDWGLSVLVPMIQPILRHAIIASGTAHMSQEASMVVLKLVGYRDAIGDDEVEDISDDPNHYMAEFSA